MADIYPLLDTVILESEGLGVRLDDGLEKVDDTSGR